MPIINQYYNFTRAFMRKRICFIVFCVFSLVLTCFSSFAQNHSSEPQPYSFPESFKVENPEISIWQSDYYPMGYYPLVLYFPIDKHLLRRDYRNNNMMLMALDEMLASDQIIENIDTIEILGACSPIASPEYNHKLSYNRCLTLRSYIESEHPKIAEKFPIQMNYIGIDYLGYSILSKKKKSLSKKEKWDMLQYAAVRLKMKDGSYIIPTSNRMKPGIQMEDKQNIATDNTFYLKPDTIYIRDYKDNEKSINVYSKTDTIYLKDTVVVVHTPEQTYPTILKRPLFLALKSNLLYDAALLPNLSAEIYLGRQWSLVAEGNWSWWTFDNPIQNHWSHRIQVGGAELRYWLKSPYPLNGHAIGIYSLFGNYGVRMFTKDENSNGYLSYQSWSAGLSYAYSMPIANRFNLEFGIAFGYVGGKYYKYNYCMRHQQWEKGTHDNEQVYNMNYFGLTRAGVSLVWLLGTGNSPKDKEKYTMWQNRKSDIVQTNSLILEK